MPFPTQAERAQLGREMDRIGRRRVRALPLAQGGDVRVLARALAAFYRTRREEPLAAYTQTALRRVWRAEHFSWWMTSMLHRFHDDDAFSLRLQRAQLDYVVGSKAASESLAENYVGLPWD